MLNDVVRRTVGTGGRCFLHPTDNNASGLAEPRTISGLAIEVFIILVFIGSWNSRTKYMQLE